MTNNQIRELELTLATVRETIADPQTRAKDLATAQQLLAAIIKLTDNALRQLAQERRLKTLGLTL